MTACLLAAHHVSRGTTTLFAVLLGGLIVCLALEEKLHAKKSVIAGLFAILCLFLGAVFHGMREQCRTACLQNGPVNLTSCGECGQGEGEGRREDEEGKE